MLFGKIFISIATFLPYLRVILFLVVHSIYAHIRAFYLYFHLHHIREHVTTFRQIVCVCVAHITPQRAKMFAISELGRNFWSKMWHAVCVCVCVVHISNMKSGTSFCKVDSVLLLMAMRLNVPGDVSTVAPFGRFALCWRIWTFLYHDRKCCGLKVVCFCKRIIKKFSSRKVKI